MSGPEGAPERRRFSISRLTHRFHAWKERREQEHNISAREFYEFANRGRSFDPDRHEDQDPLDPAQSNNGSPAYRTRMP